MTQTHVRNFVGNYRGELMLGSRPKNKPAVDANISTRYRKRVDRIVAHDKETIIAHAVVDTGQQAKAKVVDVTVQYRLGLDKPPGQQSLVKSSAEILLTLDIDSGIFAQRG